MICDDYGELIEKCGRDVNQDTSTKVESKVVKTIVVKQSSKDPYDVSNSKCPNYFERDHGGKTCEIQRNRCGSSKRLCNQDFRGCKRVESAYNKRFTRNHGKIDC